MNEPHGLDRLTARERETLRLVSVHMTSKEIARRLGISPKTVDRHLANAIRKLEVSSRWAATRLLIEASLPSSWDEAAEKPPTQPSPMAGGGVGGHPPDHSRGADSPEAPRRRGDAPWFAGHGLVAVIVRVLVDALLIFCFFAVLAAGASAAHWIVLRSEAAHVDHNVILMLKGVHYALVAIDGLGVVLATAMLTFRFLKALKDAK